MQGLSEPRFLGDLVSKLRKIAGNPDFSRQLTKQKKKKKKKKKKDY